MRWSFDQQYSSPLLRFSLRMRSCSMEESASINGDQNTRNKEKPTEQAYIWNESQCADVWVDEYSKKGLQL